jgi:3-oxosteroid 1-dehydrogenase
MSPTRRQLLVGGAAASTVASAALVASGMSRKRGEGNSVDIVVIGSGAAGSVAALYAAKAGASVEILEAADHAGGTSAKSGGNIWIPANSDMARRGVSDSETDFLKFAAWASYPDSFDPKATAFYAHASKIVAQLDAEGALRTMPFHFGPETAPRTPDYFDDVGMNPGSAQGRVLSPRTAAGTIGAGDELMDQLGNALRRAEIAVHLRHRVTGLLRNHDGAIEGVAVETPDGLRRFAARRGVVFASGGFAHNADVLSRFHLNPLFGACALPTARGDIIALAEGAGARLGNMSGAWRAQVVLDDVSIGKSTPQDVWLLPGDSVLMVDRHGRRTMNEKRDYHSRAKSMYAIDANTGRYRSLLHFAVYDRRAAELWAGYHPYPPVPTGSPYVISAPSIAQLATAIETRLRSLADFTRGETVAPDFGDRLKEEVKRFNNYAKSGNDPDFQRGRGSYDLYYHAALQPAPGTPWPENPFPNPTMHPLTDDGPYFALILAPGALDTNGGPVIDERGRIIGADGTPIPKLFGAGNCVASLARDAYWAAGATLGAAITFGAIAGTSAAGGTI